MGECAQINHPQSCLSCKQLKDIAQKEYRGCQQKDIETNLRRVSEWTLVSRLHSALLSPPSSDKLRPSLGQIFQLDNLCFCEYLGCHQWQLTNIPCLIICVILNFLFVIKVNMVSNLSIPWFDFCAWFSLLWWSPQAPDKSTIDGILVGIWPSVHITWTKWLMEGDDRPPYTPDSPKIRTWPQHENLKSDVRSP